MALNSLNPQYKISLLLPSRGRPQLAEQFLQSVVSRTADLLNVEVIIYLDSDDPTVDEYSTTMADLPITKIVGPRIGMGACNTACLSEASGDIVILVNDDLIIRTDHWDQRIREVHARFSDQIYLAYCNDLFKESKNCAFPILSKSTCSHLVEPYPKEYQGAFIDTHLLDIFQRLKYAGHDRIIYLEDVVFEHMHYRLGKSSYDDTYQARDRFADDNVFLLLVKSRRYFSQVLKRVIDKKEDQSSYEFIPDNRKSLAGLVSYSYYCITEILLDSGLPWAYKSRMWFWFMARYFARKWPNLLLRVQR